MSSEEIWQEKEEKVTIIKRRLNKILSDIENIYYGNQEILLKKFCLRINYLSKTLEFYTSALYSKLNSCSFSSKYEKDSKKSELKNTKINEQNELNIYLQYAQEVVKAKKVYWCKLAHKREHFSGERLRNEKAKLIAKFYEQIERLDFTLPYLLT